MFLFNLYIILTHRYINVFEKITIVFTIKKNSKLIQKIIANI